MHPVTPTSNSLACRFAIQPSCPALFNAICLTGAVHEAAGREISPQPNEFFKKLQAPTRTQIAALEYKSTSLRLLSESLTESQELATMEMTILCVTILLALETVVGEPSAILAHTNGLLRMVGTIGGMKKLPSQLCVQVQIACVKAAIILSTAPVLTPPLSYRHPSMHLHSDTSTPDDSQSPCTSLGFFSEPLKQLLPFRLKQYLLTAQKLCLAIEHNKSSSQASTQVDIINFINLEANLLRLKIYQTLDPFVDSVRIATLLYVNTAMWKTPLYFGWVIALVDQLKDTVSLLNWSVFTEKYPELFIWMLLLGRHCGRSRSSDERSWWELKLWDLAHVLKVYEWEELKPILTHYFHRGDLWKETWQVVIAGFPEGEMTTELQHPCSLRESLLP